MLEVGTLLLSRFEITRTLGAGGMGVVYEALDRRRNHRIALKTLAAADPQPIYHLKNEFRSLADVVHPNLVSLYELVSDGDTWFFTMELIDGCSFTEHVWGRLGAFEPTATMDAPPEASTPSAAPASGAPRIDQDRLIDVFQQFALGVDAIHLAGKLHRDLKPSNVLVRRDGRVKIVDFGLAGAEAPGSAGNTLSRHLAGTPAYMAPEQARSEPATAASDWYAFGTMLYEVITGRVPFTGSVGEVLVKKQGAPPPIPLHSPLLPHLHDLCTRLLSADPGQRPRRTEVLRHLGIRGARPSVPPVGTGRSRARSDSRPPFVGRDAELRALFAALDDAESKGVIVVRVHAVSGMGKSALLEQFAEQVVGRAGAIVLRARCHERESVPFKGVDGIIDGLTRHLRVQPPLEAARMLPRDVRALARVFPVLNRLEAVAGVRQRRQLPQDPVELRRRAASAFGALLGNLSDTAPLVLCVDDFQWADVDSAAWFREVLTLPEAPPCLFVAAHRTDQSDAAPVRTLFDGLVEAGVEPQVIELSGLSATDVAELTRTEDAGQATSKLWEESGGNPFLIRELLREGSGGGRAALDLDGAIRARAARLDETARGLLDLLCLTGRPTPAGVLARALDIEDEISALAILRADGFIRDGGGGRIEPYHDRIREALVAGLPPERTRYLHARLAPVLESRHAEPEILVDHFLGAGYRGKALHHAVLAAERATEALAFERAARFLELAANLLPVEREHEAGGLHRRRGAALASAGRCLEASEVYTRAAATASGGEAATLRALAAAQRFLGGYVHEGIAGLLDALQALGVKIASDPGAQLNEAFAAQYASGELMRQLLTSPAWRSEADLSAEERLRLDLLWATWSGLNGFDQSPLVMLIGAQFVEGALKAREPNHCIAAAYAQLLHLAITSAGNRSASEALLERATPLAHPGWGAAMRESAAGTAAHFRRDVVAAVRHFDQAIEIFDAECPGRNRERSSAVFYCVANLWAAGRIREAITVADRERHAARERGDFFTDLYMTLYALGDQANDQPERARSALAHAVSRLDAVVGDGPSRAYVGVARMIAAWRRADVELHAGEPEAALEILRRHHADWGHSPLMQLPVHLYLHHLFEIRARTAIAMSPGSSTGDVEAAAQLGRRLVETATPDVRAFGQVGLAGLAVHRRQREDALQYLQTALEYIDDLGPTFGPCVRMQIGRLKGGVEGERLVRDAELALAAEGIVNPRRWAAAWTFPM